MVDDSCGSVQVAIAEEKTRNVERKAETTPTKRSNRRRGLRTFKLWNILVWPFKRRKKRRERRSGSERSSRNTPRLNCPPSPSLPDIHTLDEITATDITAQDQKVVAGISENGCDQQFREQQLAILKVQITDNPVVCRVQYDDGDTLSNQDYDSTEDEDDNEQLTATSPNNTTMLLEGYDRVHAKEPNLEAKPEKPALKKHGQPSRFRMKKRSTPKKENVASPGSSNDGLPTRLTDDSDSDGPIQYRDDPVPSTAPLQEDDDEEVPIESALASKVHRRDTLACRLDAPPCKDDIGGQTSEDRKQLMHKASIKLARKLSERPTVVELEERNILKKEDESSMEEKRKLLLRKLSFRPTISQLKEQQIIQFNDYVEVTQAEIYDRKGDKPWTRLTPTDKALIRKELNDFKATEMDVHEESRVFTRFHRN